MAISVSFVSERLSLHIHKGCLSISAGAVRALNWVGLGSVWEASQWVALGDIFHNQ